MCPIGSAIVCGPAWQAFACCSCAAVSDWCLSSCQLAASCQALKHWEHGLEAPPEARQLLSWSRTASVALLSLALFTAILLLFCKPCTALHHATMLKAH